MLLGWSFACQQLLMLSLHRLPDPASVVPALITNKNQFPHPSARHVVLAGQCLAMALAWSLWSRRFLAMSTIESTLLLNTGTSSCAPCLIFKQLQLHRSFPCLSKLI